MAVAFELSALEAACVRLRLRFLVAFGSRAAGKEKPGSDLDLGCYPEGSFDLLEAYDVLSPVFPGVELDVVNVRAAGPLLRREVMDGTLLWGPGDFFYEYRLFAYRDYIDSADLRKLGRVLMEKRLKYIKDRMDAPA